MTTRTLLPTSWLAKRLGLSVTTITRLRAAGSPDLPPALRIGCTVRYDEASVEAWIRDRLDHARAADHA